MPWAGRWPRLTVEVPETIVAPVVIMTVVIMGQRGDTMALLRWFGGRVGTVLLTAVAAEAGATVSMPAVDVPSVVERVAAIRAKAAELSAAQVREEFDGSAQLVAWNDWKNG